MVHQSGVVRDVIPALDIDVNESVLCLVRHISFDDEVRLKIALVFVTFQHTAVQIWHVECVDIEVKEQPFRQQQRDDGEGYPPCHFLHGDIFSCLKSRVDSNEDASVDEFGSVISFLVNRNHDHDEEHDESEGDTERRQDDAESEFELDLLVDHVDVLFQLIGQ